MIPLFNNLTRAPDDPILGLPKLFNSDPRQDKVNLGIGSYMTEEGTSYLFKCVEKAEKDFALHNGPKDYLPIDGNPLFLKNTIYLNLQQQTDPEEVFAVQTIGGTGALSLAAEFLAKYLSKTIAISDPSWANHAPLFRIAGFDVQLYPYYDNVSHKIRFDEIKSCLSKLPPSSIVLLQAACHNPTGADFSKEEWQELMELIKEKKLFPLFDNAYQGLGISIEEDVYPLKLFHKNKIDMMIATANSKNFGLYGERIGALIFSLPGAPHRMDVLSQIRIIIRSHYSSPPIQGAKIVGEILEQPALRKEWEAELKAILNRIHTMRTAFTKELISQSKNSKFTFLNHDKGFFSLLGISEEQVLALREKNGIYMPLNGRINMAGLTASTINYVSRSIANIL
jgi:aspartate/tyrosine/aromatic aminotransferase